MFILGSPNRAYDSRYKLICKHIFSEKIGKILILIPLSGGQIHASSVSFGDQVIVFGGKLGRIQDGFEPTDLIGKVSPQHCFKS